MDSVQNMLKAARGNAFAYRIISERYDMQIEKWGQGEEINSDEFELALPCVLLLSFSCELYLKIIITKKGLTYKNTHDLLWLYNILDDVTRRKIREYSDETDENEFAKILQENKDTFPEWRYFYGIDLDKKPGNFTVVDAPFLDKLLRGLEKVTEELMDSLGK